MDIVLDFIKKYLKTFVLAVAAFVIFIICLIFSSCQTGRVAQVNRSAAQLESQLQLFKEKQKEKQVDTSVATGIDTSRLNSDFEAMETFLKEVLTFNSYDEYSACRIKCKNDYGLEDDDEFLRIFYQEVTDDTENSDRYKRVKGENDNCQLEFKDFSPYLISLDGPVYTYMCDVVATSQDQEYRFAVVCDVDKDAQIKYVRAYTIKEGISQ